MVPYADMLNHSSKPNTKWNFYDESNMFYLVSNKDLLTGEILTDSYGDKPNYQYLIYYGFILPENHKVLIDGKLIGLNQKIELTSSVKTEIRNKLLLLKKDMGRIKGEDDNICRKIIIELLETEISILRNILL